MVLKPRFHEVEEAEHADYAAFGVVYFLTEVPLMLALVALHRRRHPRTDSTSSTETGQ